jgi:prepilin signal peptidase PulO-like enzyme (type II secretory pathway)
VTSAFLAIFGLIVGSFLNVVISRLPERRSLLGRSACPQCGQPIAAYDNIPLLSFAVLRGQCRACGRRIPWRYPLVELATAGAMLAAHGRFGFTPPLAVAATLLAALIAVTVIDLQHQIIPDLITLPGIIAGLVGAPAAGMVSWLESLLGIAVCGGLLLMVVVATGGGMGSGDMKLGAMLGAFLGWRLGLFALLVAVLLGGIVAAGLLLTGRKGRKDALPFGPFLALGGTAALLVDPPAFLSL